MRFIKYTTIAAVSFVSGVYYTCMVFGHGIRTGRVQELIRDFEKTK